MKEEILRTPVDLKQTITFSPIKDLLVCLSVVVQFDVGQFRVGGRSVSEKSPSVGSY